MYSWENASGKFCKYKSMQEKLPVAGSMYESYGKAGKYVYKIRLPRILKKEENNIEKKNRKVLDESGRKICKTISDIRESLLCRGQLGMCAYCRYR